MQRNYDLVTAILVSLYEAPSRSLTPEELSGAVRAQVGAVTAEMLAHHLDLLHDGDYIKPLADGWRLTWQGYDVLEYDDEDGLEDEDYADEDDGDEDDDGDGKGDKRYDD